MELNRNSFKLVIILLFHIMVIMIIAPITRAQITGLRKYPWMIRLGYRLNKHSNATHYVCGGFLVSGRYVVTAAHCVDSLRSHIVALGEHDAHKDPDCVISSNAGTECNDGVTIIPVESIYVHPEYDNFDENFKNDIALIRLSQTANYTDYIRPICLPASDITVQPPLNLRLYLAGWGASQQVFTCPKHSISMNNCTWRKEFDEIKRHLELPYKTLDECQSALDSLTDDMQLWSKQICAGGELGKNICSGDSGGPLMHHNNGVFEAVGITSYSSSHCGLIHFPGVFTKVYEYTDWIRNKINDDDDF